MHPEFLNCFAEKSRHISGNLLNLLILPGKNQICEESDPLLNQRIIGDTAREDDIIWIDKSVRKNALRFRSDDTQCNRRLITGADRSFLKVRIIQIKQELSPIRPAWM